MKILIISLMVVFGFTCGSAQNPERLTVKNAGQEVSKTGRITVKFLELIEDSRCPEDVDCAWAGIARIKVQLGRNGKTADVELNTQNMQSTVFQGFSVTLIELVPRQSTMSRYSPSAYSATFTISKAGK